MNILRTVAAADYILIPADKNAEKTALSFQSGRAIEIDGARFFIEDLDQRSSKTESILRKYVVPKLHVKKTPLRDVLSFLQQSIIDIHNQAEESSYFHFEIVAPNEVDDTKVSSDFEGKRLEVVLKQLASQAGCSVSIQGSRIVFKKIETKK